MKFILSCVLYFSLLTIKAQVASWTVYNASNSGIASNLTLKVAVDTTNNKYFGTEGGLSLFNNNTWINYNTLNSPLPENEVTAIAFEANGVLWIGVDGGLLKRESNAWTLYTPANSGLPGIEVTAIAIQNDSIKWIGTEDGGLARFDDVNWTVFNTTNSGIADNIVTALAVDTNGGIGVGSELAGISYYDGTNWTIYNTGNSGLPNDIITDIAVDQQNNKWISTEEGGLAKFDGTTWTTYNITNSDIPDNSVIAVSIDSSGNVWVGTESAGAAKFDGSTWTAYNTSNSGLPENVITDIAFDLVNGVWFTTETQGAAKLCMGVSAQITANGSTAFCAGDSTILNANPGNYSYQWYFNSQPVSGATDESLIANQQGSYFVIVTDSSGCGSTSNGTAVIVHPSPVAPTISQAGNTLASSYSSGNQWYFNNTLIPGATSQLYTATQTGFYSVEHVDVNNCSSISALYSYSPSNITEFETAPVLVYPNPVSDELNIISSINQSLHIDLYDFSGRHLLEKKAEGLINRIIITGLTSGVYTMLIRDENSVIIQKRKIVKL